jgi:hypothetical protein
LTAPSVAIITALPICSEAGTQTVRHALRRNADVYWHSVSRRDVKLWESQRRRCDKVMHTGRSHNGATAGSGVQSVTLGSFDLHRACTLGSNENKISTPTAFKAACPG